MIKRLTALALTGAVLATAGCAGNVPFYAFPKETTGYGKDGTETKLYKKGNIFAPYYVDEEGVRYRFVEDDKLPKLRFDSNGRAYWEDD